MAGMVRFKKETREGAYPAKQHICAAGKGQQNIATARGIPNMGIQKGTLYCVGIPNMGIQKGTQSEVTRGEASVTINSMSARLVIHGFPVAKTKAEAIKERKVPAPESDSSQHKS
eukprot:1151027-Pelagomonas_calceolata.AAC.3